MGRRADTSERTCLVTRAAGPTADLIRFGTYNLCKFGDDGHLSDSKSSALAAIMGEIDADVWAVQEILSETLFEQQV